MARGERAPALELEAHPQMTRLASTPEPPTLAYLATVNRVTGVWCLCEDCQHSATVALDGLIERFGPDAPFPAVRDRLRCGRCHSGAVYARPNWPAAVGKFVGFQR